MSIEKDYVSLGSLSNFLHYFELNFDQLGIENYSHDQAFTQGLKMTKKQCSRLNYFFLHNKNDELKKFMRELKMIN